MTNHKNSKPALRPLPALLLGALAGFATTAYAQEPQKTSTAVTAATPAAPAKPATPNPASAPKDGEFAGSVTVAAERPTNRIDRQVYDVKSDESASNGSAADALNNVPSVAVDPDGTVTLRGSSNVQILVDGKPSAMFQGEARGAALQSVPAEDLESVEVINNPGAEFGNEGGGGPILNLVMKRSRKPGGFGSATANYGTAGRYNSSVNGSYNEGRWGFQGGASVRHDGRDQTTDTVRDRIDPLTGEVSHSTQNTASSGLNDMGMVHGTVSYNYGDRDTFTGSANYNRRANDSLRAERYLSLDPDGNPLDDYTRTVRGDGDNTSYAWGARWDHKGTLPGESLKTDLRVSSTTADSTSNSAAIYNVGNVRGSPLARQDRGTSNKVIDFTGDYERPLAGGVLKAGYKAAQNRTTDDSLYNYIDPDTFEETTDPMRSNDFRVKETVLAAYATYQMRLNERWGLLAGMRYEHTDVDIDQLTSRISAGNQYSNWIPSAFATYKVSDDTNLRFAYSHRIRRPNGNDLNPYVIYRDEFNVSSGNPQLKPTQTDSFEIGYESRIGKMETNLRGYFRREDDAILERKYFIDETTLLTTRDNLGSNRSGGLEFTVTGKLLPTLTLNTSGNLARSRQTQIDDDGVQTRRNASSLSGRVRLNWQATAMDSFQAAIQAQGKMLTGQGYREPNTTVNLTYTRVVTPALRLIVNATDIFDRNKIQTYTDTPTLREESLRRAAGRIVYVGLRYSFGTTPPGRRDDGERGPGFRGPPPGGFGPGGPGPGGPGGF